MALFKRKKIEERAEGEVSVEDPILQALFGNTGVTKSLSLQIPTVASAVDLISGVIASTPIKLYKDIDGKSEEVKNDIRVALLNDETGDTLNSNEFWKAMIPDYYLGKGGYAYINKEKGKYKSVHYVDETYVTVQKNTDPIFKDYNLLVNGKFYKPYDFIKILRNTKDGASGTSIISDSSKILEVVYESLVFESNLVKKGGNKKGFLKAAKRLTDIAMDALKAAFAKLYSNNSENVVVLNDGLEFIESSNTSVEMQLNENKKTNSEELSKLFHVSTGVISGNATEAEMSSLAKIAAIPLMKTIECALNRDFLLEKEKHGNEVYYWAFDTKELLKGNMKERFDAYKTAIDGNFMQIDEVRYTENLPSLGLTWIKLGLDSVLYDVTTGKIYTPNTNKVQDMTSESLKEVVAEDVPKGGD